MPEATGRIVSVNVGRPRKVLWQGHDFLTSIVKEPVAEPVRVTPDLLEGDRQADPEHHGRPDQRLYAYAAEDYAWWSAELGRDLAPGWFGENLTLSGIEVSGALIGERWQVGQATLQVTGPRVPCYKLGWRMGDTGFPRRFTAAGRPGAYLRLIAAGEVAPGEVAVVLHRPQHDVTVADVLRGWPKDRVLAARLVELPETGPLLREWALRVLGR